MLNGGFMYQDVVYAINSEFSARKLRNSSYTLRAYARDLDISPAYLSLVLNKKVQISKKKAKHIIQSIYSPKESKQLLSLIETIEERFFFKGQIPEYKKVYSQITLTWAHYATLEAFNLCNFSLNIEQLSNQLGIEPENLQKIINDLINLNAIYEENGELKSNELSFSTIKDKNTTKSRKQMQKDLLNKSLKAIDSVDIKKRNHTSMTIAINDTVIDKMKERIQTFQRELCNEASSLSSNKENAVYQLQISLFPLIGEK